MLFLAAAATCLNLVTAPLNLPEAKDLAGRIGELAIVQEKEASPPAEKGKGRGHAMSGTASWYGRELHGSKMANGQRFNMYAFTAAHKTLPLGTKLKVLDPRTGASVYVSITDRGPYIRGRVIDLSWAAAKELGIENRGLGHVELTVLEYGKNARFFDHAGKKPERKPERKAGRNPAPDRQLAAERQKKRDETRFSRLLASNDRLLRKAESSKKKRMSYRLSRLQAGNLPKLGKLAPLAVLKSPKRPILAHRPGRTLSRTVLARHSPRNKKQEARLAAMHSRRPSAAARNARPDKKPIRVCSSL